MILSQRHENPVLTLPVKLRASPEGYMGKVSRSTRRIAEKSNTT